MESELMGLIKEELDDKGILGVDNVLICLVNAISANRPLRRTKMMQVHLPVIASTQQSLNRDIVTTNEKFRQRSIPNAKRIHDSPL